MATSNLTSSSIPAWYPFALSSLAPPANPSWFGPKKVRRNPEPSLPTPLQILQSRRSFPPRPWPVQCQGQCFRRSPNNCRLRTKKTKKNYLPRLQMSFADQPGPLQPPTSSPLPFLRNPSPGLPPVLTIPVQVRFRLRILAHGFRLTLKTLIPLSPRFPQLVLRALSSPVASASDRHAFTWTPRRKK